MERLLRVALALALLTQALCETNHCANLESRSEKMRGWAREVAWQGRARELVLHCGSAPACAASELLRAALVHMLAHRNVTVQRGAHALVPDHAFANLNYSENHNYLRVLVGVSVAWVPRPPAPAWREGHTGGLAAPRLIELGASSVPARRRLFARLSPQSGEHNCTGHNSYLFYADSTKLHHCQFSNDSSQSAVIHVVSDHEHELCLANKEALAVLQDELEQRAAASGLRLRLQPCTRAKLLGLLDLPGSLLFLDYDIWDGQPNVTAVQPPPCTMERPNCNHELDSSVAIRVADEVLKNWSPELFKYIHRISYTQKDIRQIFKMESNGTSIEEAACAVVYDNMRYFTKLRESFYKIYTAVIFFCTEDPDYELYENFIKHVGPRIKSITAKAYFGININEARVTCSDENKMRSVLHDNYTTRGYQFELVGILLPGGEAARQAAPLARVSRVPLLVYDVADEHQGAWLLKPRAHSTLALARFIHVNRWSRVAVISEATALAESFVKDMSSSSILVYDVRLDLTNIDSVFLKLRSVNAHIIFINADSAAAATVLASAVEQRMVADSEYVWIAREWHPSNKTSRVRHYTISTTWHTEREVRGNNSDKEFRTAITAEPWPRRHGAAIADGIKLLATAFTEVFRREPGARNDMRSDATMTALESNLNYYPINGTTHSLQFKNRTLEASWMYLEEWHGDQRKLLATWYVNVSESPTDSMTPPDKSGALASPPHDGTGRCVFPGGGDPFAPPCYDWAWACGLVALALAPLGVWLARRHVRRRLERRDRELLVRLLARRDLVAATLADWLVDRSALHMREELGAGQFGRVHLALLRVPGRATRVVAAKALHDGAAPTEESDFLREACTLASLAHPHVLRLIGVCVEGGPPLMLTEVAFFGDLHKYLRERRHLLEDGNMDMVKGEAHSDGGEATHVSAEALTRLAREAASALAYLASRGMMHRDVRAANCLVDSTRSLKLGDFGMARETGASEYVCVRRTIVPVRWMAPESLMHGVFSSASDVWALGVLVVEVMTLGARPFGIMPLPRVLEYVSAGGLPPLPLDATPVARALACLCWRREAAARPSAAEVEACLAANPCALRPALTLDLGPTDADNGYGKPCTPSVLPFHASFLSIHSLLHDSADTDLIKY